MENIFIGNTVAEAIQKGLNELDVSISDVNTEIVSNPSSGFFGFGAKKATVKITLKSESKQTVKSVEKVVKTQQNTPEITPKVNVSDKEKRAVAFVDELLSKMKVDAKAYVLEGKGSDIFLEIKGENLGSIIGRRGETLDALQYITGLAIKEENAKEKIRVIIDAENYRAKRVETLQGLANKMYGKVIKSKRNMTLEAMNPFERRVIHEVLQDLEGVHSFSTGSEPNRRVVIGFGDKK